MPPLPSPGHSSHVAATSRQADNASRLQEVGADQIFIDTGSVAAQVKEVCFCGIDRVLELVGTTTLQDSLRCAKPGGIVCTTGMVGDRWSLQDCSPMDAIPSAVCLTTCDSGVVDFMRTALQELVDQVAAGTLRVQIGRAFRLAEIAGAHRCMEEIRASGKIVVLP